MAAKTKDIATIHREAMVLFDNVWNQERDQRKLAIEDMRFAHSEDGQWEEEAVTKRKDRPRYTLNRVAGAIDQVCGGQRQNRTQIKVRPVSDGTDDIAKVEMGLIRNIENKSDAESIYDAAFDETVTCGYGGWRVLTEFTDDDSFEQEVVFSPIKSAASSLFFDPSAQKYDKRDAMWAFYLKDMTLEAFKKAFPGATTTDFSDKIYHSGNCTDWFRDNLVRVAEYWVVDLVPAEIALMSDGRVINITEEKDVIYELAAEGITVVDSRKTQIRKIHSFIMSGAEILKGPMPWAGKYIPLIPVFGRTFNIEGKEYVRGITRFAKDPQRIYNYASSNAIETTALTPKDPYWITAAQAKGYEDKLRSFNTSNSPFLIYNGDPSAPGAPQRTGAPQLQQSLIQQVQQAAGDIEATTGLFAPAMGNAPQLLSEKAVLAQADKGDRSTFVFSDNLHKSIKLTGDILVDLLPRIYDTQRVIRVLNFDGSTENVEINAKGINEFNDPVLDDETGKQVIVNDLARGKYETYIEAGPAYTTLRKESAQQLIDLASASPRFEALATDLIAKNLDVLETDELTKRVRKQMISEGIVDPTEDEVKDLGLDQPQEPSPEQTALLENIQMQNAEIIARIERMNAETDKIDAQALDTKMTSQGRAIKAYQDLIDAYKNQTEIGIDLGITEEMLRKAQQGIIDLSQEELVVQNV
jgi:hypothetical protein